MLPDAANSFPTAQIAEKDGLEPEIIAVSGRAKLQTRTTPGE
jgi:hypothetical protein